MLSSENNKLAIYIRSEPDGRKFVLQTIIVNIFRNEMRLNIEIKRRINSIQIHIIEKWEYNRCLPTEKTVKV